MIFAISDIQETTESGHRRWTGAISLHDHPGTTPVQVDFYVAHAQVTINALGGIAFAEIPFPTQDFRAFLERREEALFPEWAEVAPAVTDQIYSLARRTSFRPIGQALGWPIPPNPNPTIYAEVLLQDGRLLTDHIALADVALLVAQEDVVEITIRRPTHPAKTEPMEAEVSQAPTEDTQGENQPS
jgi:hypothetical protein